MEQERYFFRLLHQQAVKKDCESVAIIGLDLAGVETRPTGFCLLEDLIAETCLLYTDREIIQKATECNPALIAIDAPL